MAGANNKSAKRQGYSAAQIKTVRASDGVISSLHSLAGKMAPARPTKAFQAMMAAKGAPTSAVRKQQAAEKSGAPGWAAAANRAKVRKGAPGWVAAADKAKARQGAPGWAAAAAARAKQKPANP